MNPLNSEVSHEGNGCTINFAQYPESKMPVEVLLTENLSSIVLCGKDGVLMNWRLSSFEPGALKWGEELFCTIKITPGSQNSNNCAPLQIKTSEKFKSVISNLISFVRAPVKPEQFDKIGSKAV